MKLLHIFVVLVLGACYPNKTVSEKKGPYLYYKIVGINVEIMKQDDITGNQIILDTASTFYYGQELFFRITFELKRNTEAERGNYPSQYFSKCSKEKINSFTIKLQAPSNEKVELNPFFKGLDTTKHYREKPFIELDMMWHNFKDVSDFVNKFNNCHPDVQQSFLQQHGLILSGSIPITQDGKYFISTEINFSDSRTLKNEIKINGKVK
jgi:hypothetical protein